MNLSVLGIFHTAIGIAALIGAITGFIKYGKIDLAQRSGKVYFYTTAITSLTALGISKHGGFNAGHVFSLFIIVLISAAYFLFAQKRKARRPDILKIFYCHSAFSCH
ncbi:hypothetical protein OWR28_17195 [Chryseobacterium sp. 1B4]